MPNNIEDGFTVKVGGQTTPTTSGEAFAQVSVFTTPNTVQETVKDESSQIFKDKVHNLECRIIAVEKDIEVYKENIPIKDFIELKSEIKQIKDSKKMLLEWAKFLIPTLIAIASFGYTIYINNAIPK